MEYLMSMYPSGVKTSTVCVGSMNRRMNTRIVPCTTNFRPPEPFVNQAQMCDLICERHLGGRAGSMELLVHG